MKAKAKNDVLCFWVSTGGKDGRSRRLLLPNRLVPVKREVVSASTRLLRKKGGGGLEGGGRKMEKLGNFCKKTTKFENIVGTKKEIGPQKTCAGEKKGIKAAWAFAEKKPTEGGKKITKIGEKIRLRGNGRLHP